MGSLFRRGGGNDLPGKHTILKQTDDIITIREIHMYTRSSSCHVKCVRTDVNIMFKNEKIK